MGTCSECYNPEYAVASLFFALMLTLVVLCNLPYVESTDPVQVSCIELHRDGHATETTLPFTLRVSRTYGLVFYEGAEQRPIEMLYYIGGVLGSAGDEAFGRIMMFFAAGVFMVLCGILCIPWRGNFVKVMVYIGSIIGINVSMALVATSVRPRNLLCEHDVDIAVPYVNCIIGHDDRVIEIVVSNQSVTECIAGQVVNHSLITTMALIPLIICFNGVCGRLFVSWIWPMLREYRCTRWIPLKVEFLYYRLVRRSGGRQEASI